MLKPDTGNCHHEREPKAWLTHSRKLASIQVPSNSEDGKQLVDVGNVVSRADDGGVNNLDLVQAVDCRVEVPRVVVR